MSSFVTHPCRSIAEILRRHLDSQQADYQDSAGMVSVPTSIYWFSLCTAVREVADRGS